jgi:hypothetical protein
MADSDDDDVGSVTGEVRDGVGEPAEDEAEGALFVTCMADSDDEDSSPSIDGSPGGETGASSPAVA